VHWAKGGATNLDNLTLLCRPHHTLVHEGGFQVERLPSGGLRFQAPDGSELSQTGAQCCIDDPDLAAFRARHAQLSLEPMQGGWQGDAMDYALAVSMLPE
jgi:hypothetical protein